MNFEKVALLEQPTRFIVGTPSPPLPAKLSLLIVELSSTYTNDGFR